GRVRVEGAGTGFGGRSLCLSKRTPPELPFEAAVTVKLDDDRGAAGLIFHADGGDKHYGFYPSGGELRLTRFDGLDVYSWKILAQKPCDAYRPGEWNSIKVRFEKGKITGFVNDQKLVELTDETYTSGQVGLAKFRDTVAEFKGFTVAKSIAAASAQAGSARALRDKARALESEAARLRKQASAEHQKRAIAE